MMKKNAVRALCFALTFAFIFSLCACTQEINVRFVNADGKDISLGGSAPNGVSVTETNTMAVNPAPTAAADTPAAAAPAAETTTAASLAANEPTTANTGSSTAPAAETTTAAPAPLSDDPAKWSVQQIVDCYKAGMQKTDDTYDCSTDQKMQLVGKLPGKASGLSGPVNLAMKLGSKPFNALTGGYWDLVPEDLVSAAARKDGKYVVIDLVPKEQTDGPGANEHEGTTGHVVNVVQGIDDFLAYVEKNFGILNASYTQEGVKIHYRDAFAKNVKINTETGEMESGEWGYTIDLHIDDASVLGISLDGFNATIQYNCWYPVAD